jgi:phosphosulfolactate synthase
VNNNILTLPIRPNKPRQYGITAIMDMGLSLAQQQHILESYSELVDIAKLGTGTAYINPILKEKISLYQKFGVHVCLGGTLFEKYFQQRKISAYKQLLIDLGLEWVEISSGIIDIPQQQLLEIAVDFQQDFIVVVEVGKKFSQLGNESWLADIQCYLTAGVDYVILEGRGTADAGIYKSNGMLNQLLINEISTKIDINKLWFETATEKAQVQIIQSFGYNANLSNVNPHDLIGLEALRVGLRAETFHIR